MPEPRPDPDAARAGPRLHTHRRHDARRAETEEFIRAVYAERFGARVDGFAPVLVTLRDGDRILAAAGYRDAAEEPLFLERYLPQHVETLLPALAPPSRRLIVEVGHLSSAQPGEGRRLMMRLAPQLAQQGFEWVVATLTEELRRLLLRIGLAPLTLGVADPSRLGADAGQWGSYYDHRPLVLAGRLASAVKRLDRLARAAEAAP